MFNEKYNIVQAGHMSMYVLAGMAVLLSGCATAGLHRIQELPVPAPQQVNVKIEADAATPMPSEAKDLFHALVTTAVSEGGFQVVSGPSTATLEGKVTKYQPGSQFMRWFLPLGLVVFGGQFDSSWALRDSSGRQLGAARVEGSIYAGVFGGDYQRVLEKAAERVKDFMTGRHASGQAQPIQREGP